MKLKRTTRPSRNSRVFFDVLYGFIPVTEVEEKIINSPFFQRLRFIKQLGFASYIFPGAEHTRFAHAIGVMHSMDQMIRALGLSVADDELFLPRTKGKTASEAALFHQAMRLSALLHDIGTFPFSHAVEFGYIRHGNDPRRATQRVKNLPNNHEHLGSFIIKNTDFEGGITQILNEHQIDVQLISDIIKGEGPYPIGNQLMHSDLDADRMDYLLRDSHYTGIKYGQFDRDYILANLVTFEMEKGQLGFGVRENAIRAVEDFLIARFNWYSQVIKNQGSAKFDIIACHLTEAFLEEDLMHQFHDILDMVRTRDERFFFWNDIYFMSRCQEIRYKKLVRDPKTLELTEMLLYRKPPRTLQHRVFDNKLISSKQKGTRLQRVKLIEKLVKQCESTLRIKGKGKAWLLVDIPEKDVVFTKSLPQLKKIHGRKHLAHLRDSVKLVNRQGEASLLVEHPNTLMKHLAELNNFVPNIYANEAAFDLLKKERIIL